MTEMNLAPTSFNHVAWRCRDAEQTRAFYEDVLGMPLTMALAFDKHSGLDEDRRYMHLFFAAGDGTLLAFFDDPDFAEEDKFKKTDGFDTHYAFNCESREAMLAIQKRIQDAGYTCLGPLHHDFIESIYFYDPNGLQGEFAYPTPEFDEIFAKKNASAHENMAEWTKNTRDEKVAKYGAEKIDYRGRK